MQSQNLLLPLNDGVPQTVNHGDRRADSDQPDGADQRSLSRARIQHLEEQELQAVHDDRNITGAVGASTPGLDKMTGFYSDFLEAAAYRDANNGLGLPYLSPGDIAIATKWNLTGSNQTTLPNVPGTVTAAQLPGFILSQQHHAERRASAIRRWPTARSTATEPSPGSPTINAGTPAAPITIGTPNTGFIMQLGNDTRHQRHPRRRQYLYRRHVDPRRQPDHRRRQLARRRGSRRRDDRSQQYQGQRPGGATASSSTA